MQKLQKLSPRKLSVFLSRGVDSVLPRTQVADALRRGVPLRIKLGIDPTTSHLHLGYLAVLRRLRMLQDLGHNAVIVVGAFTARFGDPTGKGAPRQMRGVTEVNAMARVLPKGLRKILDPARTRIVSNSRWFEKMQLDEFLRIASVFTAAQMLERDMFVMRKKFGREVFLQELLYPVMQAYDSVAIHSTLTIVGSDQLFNELAARRLQTSFNQQPQGLITLKILPGTEGKEKMSQSLGNTIGIFDDPGEKFGKLMSLPDHAVERYAELLSDLPLPTVRRAIAKGGIVARNAKIQVAHAVISQIDGEPAARKAARAFIQRFRFHKLPSRMPTFALRDTAHTLIEVLVAARAVPSKSAARRLVLQGGVRVDGVQVQNQLTQVVKGSIIQIGKQKSLRLV